MKIVLLGATGATGVAFINYIQNHSKAGHEVTAIVRDPSKLEKFKSDSLKIVKADVFNSESLKPHFENQDIVVSGLGFRGKNEEFPRSMEQITKAMRDSKVDKIQIVGSQYNYEESRKNSWNESWILGFFVNYVIRKPLEDHHRMVNFLKEKCQDLKWKYCAYPGLAEMEPTNKDFRVVENTDVVPDRSGSRVSRGDAARYIIENLENYKQGEVAIVYK